MTISRFRLHDPATGAPTRVSVAVDDESISLYLDGVDGAVAVVETDGADLTIEVNPALDPTWESATETHRFPLPDSTPKETP